jgi:hypothetical protein
MKRVAKRIKNDVRFLRVTKQHFCASVIWSQSRCVLNLDAAFWGRNEMETTSVLKPLLVIVAFVQPNGTALPRIRDAILPLLLPLRTDPVNTRDITRVVSQTAA